VLLGSASERHAAREWSRPFEDDPGWGFGVGELSLLEVSALLTRCDLLVSVDSGVMHLGSAVGTPVLGLFGPTDAAISGPYWGRRRVLGGQSADGDRYDCYRYPGGASAGSLVDLDGEDVWRTAREMLSGIDLQTPSGPGE
jgi:ADP-heptose:LPS heptosyltransferase